MGNKIVSIAQRATSLPENLDSLISKKDITTIERSSFFQAILKALQNIFDFSNTYNQTYESLRNQKLTEFYQQSILIKRLNKSYKDLIGIEINNKEDLLRCPEEKIFIFELFRV